MRGPLRLLKEKFLSDTDAPRENVLDYVSYFRECLHKACAIIRHALIAAQGKMKRKFDKKVVQRKFEVGVKVLTSTGPWFFPPGKIQWSVHSTGKIE